VRERGRGLVARARAHAGRFPRPFWVLLAGGGLQAVGFGLILPYFSIYLTDTIGAGKAESGAVLALWSVALIATGLVGGVLADRFGRRPVMLGGLVGSAGCFVAFGLVSSLWAAAILAVLLGVFGSLFFPAAAAYVADVVPPELRTEGYGLYRVFQSGGIALGPPLGALLIWLVSLRAAFVAAGVVTLLAVVLQWGLPESLPAGEEAEGRGRLRSALRDRSLLSLVLGGLVIGIAFGVYESVLPVFLHEERGMAIATWGLVYGISPLLVALFQYPIARWAGGQSSRGVLAVGAVLHGAGLALLWPFAGIGVLVAAVIVFTLGQMLTVPVQRTMAATLAPVDQRGTYQGAVTLTWEAGFGPGSFVGLWLIGLGYGEALLAAMLPLSLLGGLFFLSLPRGSARGPAALAT